MMNNSRYMVKTQNQQQIYVCVVVFCTKRSSFSWSSAQIWLGKHKRTYFFMKICRYGLENQDQTYKNLPFSVLPNKLQTS
jgi:hypothetical protein